MQIFVKVNGRYIGVAPGTTRVYADRTAKGPWEAIEATNMGDGLFECRFVQTQLTLCLNPQGVFETRPAGTFGEWEQIRLTNQPEGRSFLYRDAVPQHFEIEE